jgi:hypothetical protein
MLLPPPLSSNIRLATGRPLSRPRSSGQVPCPEPHDDRTVGTGSLRTRDKAICDITDVVRAMLFDVFGTVVDWRSGIAREAAGFLSRHGLHTDPYSFADAWRRRYDPALEEVRSGRRPFTRLDTCTERISRRLCERLARIPPACPRRSWTP